MGAFKPTIISIDSMKLSQRYNFFSSEKSICRIEFKILGYELWTD